MVDIEEGAREAMFGGSLVRFEQPAVEHIETDGRIVVLFNSDFYEMGDMMVGRNIVAYDEDGNELWRVEDHGLRRPAAPDVPDAFFDIHVDDDGRLWGGTPGIYLGIDLGTGKIVGTKGRY